MNKKQLQSEQTKKKIAHAARNLFVQKGYKATSIEDIVEATGSSKGNIYYHFKSKEGLFLYLIEEWDYDWDQKWREKESLYPTTIDKFFGFAEQMVLEDLNHPLTKSADEFFKSEEQTSEMEERITDMVQRHLQFNQQLIQEGIDAGQFLAQDTNSLAVILEGLMFGLSHMSRKSSLQEALALYHNAIKVFLYGIAANRPEDQSNNED